MTCKALASEIQTVYRKKIESERGSQNTLLRLIEPSQQETSGHPRKPCGELADWNFVMFEPYHTPNLCKWAQSAMDLLLYLKRSDPGALDTLINTVGGHHPRWTGITYGRSALHNAVSNGFPSLVAALLSVPGIDVNIRDYSGRSPLNQAFVGNCNIRVVTELVRAGADFGVMDEEGKTPLNMAILFRCGDWLPLLIMDYIQGYDYHRRDKSGRTLLEWVSNFGNVESSIVNKIKEKTSNQITGD